MSNNPQTPKDIIKAYLDGRAEKDKQFAASYAKPNKNIDECFRYILGEAAQKGSAVCMSDDEVFSLAMHYYDEDDIKIASAPKARVSTSKPTPKVELTEEEKAAARESAQKAYEALCITELAKEAANRNKAEAKKLAKQKKALRAEYPTLF